MTTDENGLQFQGQLPILLSSIQCLPADAELLAVNDANESLLKASLLLHEIPDLEDHDPVSTELRRQDIKINFLLDMVGELLAQNNIIPPAQDIRLNPDSLHCRADGGVRPGDRMAIEVFIEPATPRPLKLFGTVETVEEQGGIGIRLSGMAQAVRDLLEKIIFRQHRRMVAMRKQETGGN